MKKVLSIGLVLLCAMLFVVSCNSESKVPENKNGKVEYKAPKGLQGAWTIYEDMDGHRAQLTLNENGSYQGYSFRIDPKTEDLLEIGGLAIEGTYNVYKGVDLLKGFSIIVLNGDTEQCFIYDDATGKMYEGAGDDPLINYLQIAESTVSFADDGFATSTFDSEVCRPSYFLSDVSSLNIDGVWFRKGLFVGPIYQEFSFKKGLLDAYSVSADKSAASADPDADGISTKLKYRTYEENGEFFFVEKMESYQGGVLSSEMSTAVPYAIYAYGGKEYLHMQGSLYEKTKGSKFVKVNKDAIFGNYREKYGSGWLCLDFEGDYLEEGIKFAFSKGIFTEMADGQYTYTKKDLTKDAFWPVYKIASAAENGELAQTADEWKNEKYAAADATHASALEIAEFEWEMNTLDNELFYLLAQKYYNTVDSKTKLEDAKTAYNEMIEAIDQAHKDAVKAADDALKAEKTAIDEEYNAKVAAEKELEHFGDLQDPHFLEAVYELLYETAMPEMTSAKMGTITLKPKYGFERTWNYISIVSVNEFGETLKDLFLYGNLETIEDISDVDFHWMTTGNYGESNIF